jgi:hypothetical protein
LKAWRIAGAVWVLSLIALSAQPAHAHTPANFFFAEWRSQDRGTTKQYYEITSEVPGDANDAFADRVADGAVKWNQININGADMHYVRNGVVANYNPFAPCGDIPHYKNGIHYRDVPDNPLATTHYCFTDPPGTNLVDSFQIVFDPDKSWFKGADYTNIGSSQFDVQGVAAHEFGHASGGWWEDFSNEGHFDNQSNPELCGSGAPDSDKHTMCVNSGSGLEASLKRSLEPHDVHTFHDAYN